MKNEETGAATDGAAGDFSAGVDGICGLVVFEALVDGFTELAGEAGDFSVAADRSDPFILRFIFFSMNGVYSTGGIISRSRGTLFLSENGATGKKLQNSKDQTPEKIQGSTLKWRTWALGQ